MRFLVLILAFVFCFAASSPFHQYEIDRFEVIEDLTGITLGNDLPKVRAGYASLKMLKTEWSVSDDGGASATSYSLGASLPPDSMILGVFYRPTALVVSASDNSISVDCESTADLIAATVMTNTTAFATSTVNTGEITYLASKGIWSDGCEIKATIGAAASGNITAGALDIFLLYVETDDSI